MTIRIPREVAVTDRPAAATTTLAEPPAETVAITHEELTRLLREPAPRQGQWSRDDYLRLTDCTNLLIEWTDGCIEVLPMPTDEHQSIAAHLYEVFLDFVRERGGKVLFAPLRLRIREGKFREPDLLLIRDARDSRRQNRFWFGADLTVEIVSPDGPKRDLVDKRRDYAEAGIPEYWIVDPRNETVTVLALRGAAYVEHGVFRSRRPGGFGPAARTDGRRRRRIRRGRLSCPGGGCPPAFTCRPAFRPRRRSDS